MIDYLNVNKIIHVHYNGINWHTKVSKQKPMNRDDLIMVMNTNRLSSYFVVLIIPTSRLYTGRDPCGHGPDLLYISH